jgi:hypothetical protein
MLSLPQPDSAPVNQHVDVQETGETMKIVLTLTYPVVPDPLSTINSLDTFHKLLRTSTKYSFELAIDRLSKHLLSRVESRPEEALRAFASAFVIGLDDLKLKLSRFCLHKGLKDLFRWDATYLPPPSPPPTPIPHPIAHAGLAGEARGEAVEVEDLVEDPGMILQPSPEFSPVIGIHPIDEEHYLPKDRRVHTIFDSAAATEICRLTALYTWCISKVKEIIEGHERPYRGTCNHCGQTHSWDRFLVTAKRELEVSGPVSDKVFTTDFFISSMNSGCAQCCKELLVDHRHQIQLVKTEIDSLRDTAQEKRSVDPLLFCILDV